MARGAGAVVQLAGTHSHLEIWLQRGVHTPFTADEYVAVPGSTATEAYRSVHQTEARIPLRPSLAASGGISGKPMLTGR